MGKMPLWPFLGVTLVGATLWNTFLLVLGMKLREHWTVVQHYSHQVDIAIVIVLVLVVTWFLRSRMGAMMVAMKALTRSRRS
jgi:membrane protein DedA with SNARE-associated domain